MFITSNQVEVPETYLPYSEITSDQLVQVVSADAVKSCPVASAPLMVTDLLGGVKV